jgi:hypothetical protein
MYVFWRVLSQLRVAHHLSDIILDSELFSLRISNEGSNYSHLTHIVGANNTAEAPNFSPFATDMIQLNDSQKKNRQAARALN